MTFTKRGLFIVVEGLDRSGKSTQANLLSKSLSATLWSFPNRTSHIGSILNNFLANSTSINDTAVHLLFSANRWEMHDTLKGLLEDGVSVVCDRYAFSGVAYSAAKGLDLEWCKNCDRGLIEPDITLYLDVSPQDASKRGDYGLERYEKVEFQTKVGEVFQKLINQNHGNFKVIKVAGKSVEDLQDEVFEIVKEKLFPDKCISSGKILTDRPISKLWDS